MKNINEHIKTGKFQKVYLLYGEEAYLKKQYKDRLTKAMLPEGDTVNYSYYEGKGTEPEHLIDLAETMPFFAERGKMFKAVKDIGYISEMGRQDEKTLLYWIAGQIKREGKQIKESAARYLVARAGTDMELLEKELEKLFSYTLGRNEITAADIEAVCTTQIANKIFDMVEAVAAKQQKKALDYYYDLLALKEPPMRILYLLSRQFRLLLEVKELMRQGYDKAQIAKTTKLHPFAAGKYMKQCKDFSGSQLRSIMEEAAEYEELVKTGRLNDRMSVELFIVKYSLA